MKIAAIVFAVTTVFFALMIFVPIGLSRFVRWMEWSQEALMAFGLLFAVLAGMFIIAWHFGVTIDRPKPVSHQTLPK